MQEAARAELASLNKVLVDKNARRDVVSRWGNWWHDNWGWSTTACAIVAACYAIAEPGTASM
jgi:hypothetical protein